MFAGKDAPFVITHVNDSTGHSSGGTRKEEYDTNTLHSVIFKAWEKADLYQIFLFEPFPLSIFSCQLGEASGKSLEAR